MSAGAVPRANMIVNGEIVAFEDAKIHLMSPAARYGLNVFEGLRGYWNENEEELYVFRLGDHMDRFVQSMKLLRFAPAFDIADVGEAVLHLLRRDGHRADCHIRTTAWLDGIGEYHATGPVGWMVYAGPRPRSRQTQSGIHVQISVWRRMSDNAMPPRIKCGANYVNARFARFQARMDGYDDAIMLNEAGRIGEGPGACLFVVRRGRLATPDVTSGILESITRATILEIAVEQGLKIDERAIDRTELYAADEAFLAGSAAEVLPVVSVDGIGIGDGARGPVTQSLQSAYFAAVAGKTLHARGWVTPVWGTGSAVR